MSRTELAEKLAGSSAFTEIFSQTLSFLFQREIEKNKRQEKFKESCEKADSHYHRSLLRHFGLEPWKRLIQINKLNIQIAEKYHSRTLLGIIIAAWQEFAKESIQEKRCRADECYRILLLRRSINSWKKVISNHICFF